MRHVGHAAVERLRVVFGDRDQFHKTRLWLNCFRSAASAQIAPSLRFTRRQNLLFFGALPSEGCGTQITNHNGGESIFRVLAERLNAKRGR